MLGFWLNVSSILNCILFFTMGEIYVNFCFVSKPLLWTSGILSNIGFLNLTLVLYISIELSNLKLSLKSLLPFNVLLKCDSFGLLIDYSFIIFWFYKNDLSRVERSFPLKFLYLIIFLYFYSRLINAFLTVIDWDL